MYKEFWEIGIGFAITSLIPTDFDSRKLYTYISIGVLIHKEVKEGEDEVSQRSIESEKKVEKYSATKRRDIQLRKM